MPAEPILNKRQMYDLMGRGAFGNRLKTWSPCEWLESCAPVPVGLRTMHLPGVQLPGYATQFSRTPDVADTILSWLDLGVSESNIVLTEGPPDDKLIFQGELTRDVRGLHFRYSTQKNISLRHAMPNAKTADGLTALMMLQGAMTPGSYDDLMAVMDTWPDHVIEVSVWSVDVGDIPNRNAIIWEVRSY
jgi:hypothetical protein